MPIYLRVACAALPILLGLGLGETTVAAMQGTPAPDAYMPPPEPQDRYAMGQSWAAKHHPEDADACPTIDLLFQSGCIAATRY
jgi:hypothetical protein